MYNTKLVFLHLVWSRVNFIISLAIKSQEGTGRNFSLSNKDENREIDFKWRLSMSEMGIQIRTEHHQHLGETYK